MYLGMLSFVAVLGSCKVVVPWDGGEEGTEGSVTAKQRQSHGTGPLQATIIKPVQYVSRQKNHKALSPITQCALSVYIHDGMAKPHMPYK